MTNLTSRALSREYLEIVSELGPNDAGRSTAESYLASLQRTNDREGSGAWALTPAILGPAELGTLRNGAETMGRIIEKLIARYLDDPDFRALFGVSPELEELTLVPTGYDQLVPFMRLDVLYDERSGNFNFCGVATDGSNGMTPSVDVTRAIQLTEAYRRFAERHEVETFDVMSGVVGALRETYRSWANADAGTRHPEHPTVGIVDYPESASSEEVADLVKLMADEGVFARFVDIRDLRIEEAGGIRRLVDSEGPIACVYRRALLDEMVEKPCDGVDALVEAARRGLACVIGGFRAWPASMSSLFSVLSSDEVASVLSSDELAFVREHVPEARRLERGADVTPYLAAQDEWLVRTSGPYRAPEAVAGVDRMDRDEWWRVLLACCEENGVVERLVPSIVESVYVGGGSLMGDVSADEPVEARMMLGLYLFRGEFGGVYARCGFEGPMGAWSNRLDMGCLVVRA